MKAFAWLAAALLLFAAAACGQAEEYSLWTGGEIDYTALPPLSGASTVKVCDTVKYFGKAAFVHGAAFEAYHGRWFVTYAYNAERENVFGEQCFFQSSADQGKTWSAPAEIVPHTPGRSASHGVLFTADDQLYCMLPAVDFLTSPWVVTTELHRYAEASGSWEYVSDVSGKFWPNVRPVQLEDGRWAVTGAGEGKARILFSEKDSLSTWSFGKLKNALMGSETAFLSSGGRILIVTRPQVATVPSTLGKGEDRYVIGYSYQEAEGADFTKFAASGLFCSPSKLYAGVLSDGRPYMIYNQSVDYAEQRNRLVIAVGDAGEVSFNRLYTLATYNGAISYPYAVEYDGVLYVAYSQSIAARSNGNQNDIMLLKIPIANIL